MKKNLMVAAVALTCGSLAGTANAASSVTLYGILDAGLSYASNQGGDHNLFGSSGNLSGNRWGLKGTEDLGGGLSAVFQLENGFELFNGRVKQGDRMFGRKAYVGLSSKDYGAVTAGRQDDSINDFLAPLTLGGGSAVGMIMQHPYDNDNTNTSFRIDNSIKYTSPNHSGFTFSGLYGFSQKAGAFSDNNAYSFGAAYANGPLSLAAAYLQANRRGNEGGAVNGDSVVGSFFASQGLLGIDATAGGARQRTYGAGVSYKLAAWKLGGVYTHTGFDNANKEAGFKSLKFDNFEVNASYALSPELALRGMYVYTMARVGATEGRDRIGFHTVGLQSDYLLSKRTTFYVAGAYQHASNNYRADLYGNQPSSNSSQFGLTTGIRHLF